MNPPPPQTSADFIENSWEYLPRCAPATVTAPRD